MELIKIGRIGKTHGVRGELKINVEDRYFDDAIAASSFVLKLGGQPLPYFIQHLRGDSTLLLKLEGVNDKETASALQSLDIYLPKSNISDANVQWEDQSVFLDWTGYLISDKNIGEIGKIEAIYELPEHYLAEVNTADKIAIIPLHFDLILSFDDDKKEVMMNLPEGILDVN